MPTDLDTPALIVVMGVSGSGKSTLASNLAQALHAPFQDGDDLHPRSNVEKMSRGEPLNDSDREPWLSLIRSTAQRMCATGVKNWDSNSEIKVRDGRPVAVIACSALKLYYRDILRGSYPAAAGNVPPPSEVSHFEHDQSSTESSPPSHLPTPTSPPTHIPQKDLDTYFVYISGAREDLFARMQSRKNHFMKASMLDSQLATLEPPPVRKAEGDEPGVVKVDLTLSPDEQCNAALSGLKALGVISEEASR